MGDAWTGDACRQLRSSIFRAWSSRMASRCMRWTLGAATTRSSTASGSTTRCAMSWGRKADMKGWERSAPCCMFWTKRSAVHHAFRLCRVCDACHAVPLPPAASSVMAMARI
eukprot:117132-Chlamydomonas_euryale.AAC.1